METSIPTEWPAYEAVTKIREKAICKSTYLQDIVSEEVIGVTLFVIIGFFLKKDGGYYSVLVHKIGEEVNWEILYAYILFI